MRWEDKPSDLDLCIERAPPAAIKKKNEEELERSVVSLICDDE